MDNFFLVKWFDWAPPKVSQKVHVANRLLKTFGFWTTLQPPRLGGGEMTNIEQRVNLYHFVTQVLAYKVPGALVELGCNEGQSSALIQKLIEMHDPSRKFHVYDSFEGLPPLASQDGSTSTFYQGQMKTTREKFIQNFQRYNLHLPEIHPGWFEETLPTQLPDQLCFAYLDGDLYDSIMVSLKYVYPRLTPGAICVLDDYADPAIYPEAWNGLPGVKAACDEFLADKPEKVEFVYSAEMSHGFFRKQ